MSIVNALSRRFIITSHARERFIERFSKYKSTFVHLKLCKLQGCQVCQDLTHKLFELEKDTTWDQTIRDKLENAKSIGIFNNDATFMHRMYDKYGYDSRFHFFTDGEILWVVIEERGRFLVKTCMSVQYPVNGSTVIRDFVRRPKYRKSTYKGR